MAQFSTGLGLAVLGGCILGAAAISSPRFSGEAFAQGTGTERRIVSAGLHDSNGYVMAFRIWSDNAIDLRNLGYAVQPGYGGGSQWWVTVNTSTWFTADNGTSAYLRADVDESRSVDSGDISAVLLDFGATTDNPPPPIDCTINAPR